MFNDNKRILLSLILIAPPYEIWQPCTGNVSFNIRVSFPHAANSMAAKNKQRKKSKATKKVTFEAEGNEPEAENSGGEEDEGEEKNTKEEEREEEELSLEEVLRLGGTKVNLPGETGPTLTNGVRERFNLWRSVCFDSFLN